ncbi:TPA: hypothetical protein MB363_004925 [Klebsiella quasipneumoniae subsp. similipneumoniae]|nr:hypothetical protein [Klebsiella quasipneumoniae subsp. similipneumoniae]
MKETKKHAIYMVIHYQSEKAGCTNLVLPAYWTVFLIAAVQFQPSLSIIKIHTLNNFRYDFPGLPDSSSILESRFSISYITSEGHSEHTMLKYGHKNSTSGNLPERREPLWRYKFHVLFVKGKTYTGISIWDKKYFFIHPHNYLCLNQTIKFVVNTGSITV